MSLLLVFALQAAAAPTWPLNLVCRGKVGRDESSATGLPWGSRKDKRVDYEEVVYFKLTDANAGEAQLPKKMWPMHREHKQGWFPLQEVKTGDAEITGKVRFHSMNKPKFKLDRITGLLTVYGSEGDFAGECTPYDPAGSARKF